MRAGAAPECAALRRSSHIHHALGVTSGVRGTPLYADVDVTFVRIADSLRWCRTNVSVEEELRALRAPRAGGESGTGRLVALDATRDHEYDAYWGAMPHRLCMARGEAQCRCRSER